MRFLIVKTSAFGDIIQAYPVLHYLKNRFPEAQIDWVVEKKTAALVKAHPLVSTVIEIDAKSWKKKWWHPSSLKEFIQCIKALKKNKYEAVFDLQGNCKSAVVTFLARAKDKVGFGWKTAPERVNCSVTTHRSNPPKGQNIRRDYLFIVQNYFKDPAIVPIEEVSLLLSEMQQRVLNEWKNKLPKESWMICPGSFWENKKMSHGALEAFLKSSYGTFQPFFVFLSGSEDEKKEAERLSFLFGLSATVLDRPDLPLLQHLMKEMKLIIAMDSLPLHLAGTCGTATFSVFGPSVGFKYRPLGSQHFTVQGSCPYEQKFEKRCQLLRSCETGACMKDLDATQLFSAFSRWWEQQNA